MNLSQSVKDLSKLVLNDKDTPLELSLQSSGASVDYILFKSGTLRELMRIERDAAKKNYKDIWTDSIVIQLREAVLKAARSGYVPGQHCHFVYYGGKNPDLKMLPRYEGTKEFLAVHGVNIFLPDIIRANDQFTMRKTVIEGKYFTHFEHHIDFKADRGAPIAAYLAFERNGMADVLVLDKAYLDAVERFGVSKGSDAWKGDFKEEMYKKTTIQRLPKHLQLEAPEDPEAGSAVVLEEPKAAAAVAAPARTAPAALPEAGTVIPVSEQLDQAQAAQQQRETVPARPGNVQSMPAPGAEIAAEVNAAQHEQAEQIDQAMQEAPPPNGEVPTDADGVVTMVDDQLGADPPAGDTAAPPAEQPGKTKELPF